jgi:hypothetical protein
MAGDFSGDFRRRRSLQFSSLPIVRFSKSAFNRDSTDGSLGEAAALAACYTESSLSVPHALRRLSAAGREPLIKDIPLPWFFMERVTNRTQYAVDVTGGGRSSAISRRMSTNRCLETATSAIWKTTQRPWLTTFAPILLFFQARQRPVFDRFGRRPRSQEVALLARA